MTFQSGDTVKVIDIGKSYTTYDQMAEWLHLENYQCNHCPENDSVYTVIGSRQHERPPNIVVGISDSTRGYLIGEEGLELIYRGKFRIGDIVRLDKHIIKVDGIVKFDESKAVLVSRKQLI